MPGPDASTLNNLAISVFSRGDPRGAAIWLQRALEVQRDATGDSAPLGAQLSNYGRILLLLGRSDEAAAPLREALALLQRFTGEDSLDTASAHFSLATFLADSGDGAAAVEEAGRAHALFATRLTDNHPMSRRVQGGLAAIQARHGLQAQALENFDAAIAGLEGGGAALHSHLATTLCERAIAIRTLRPEQARADARRCVELRRRSIGAAHWETAEATALAESLAAAGADSDAARQALAMLEDTLGPDSPRTLRARAWFARR